MNICILIEDDRGITKTIILDIEHDKNVTLDIDRDGSVELFKCDGARLANMIEDND